MLTIGKMFWNHALCVFFVTNFTPHLFKIIVTKNDQKGTPQDFTSTFLCFYDSNLPMTKTLSPILSCDL